jgi:hypothetical protein
VTRRILSTATRAAAYIEYALTEALTEATLTKAEARQYRRSMGDRIAAIVAWSVLGLVSVAVALAILSAVFISAAVLGSASVSPLYYGWPSPRAAIPGCLLGGAAMLRGYYRLLRGFRRLDGDPSWPSAAYSLMWVYAGGGMAAGSLWAAYACVCDDVSSSLGGPLIEFQ